MLEHDLHAGHVVEDQGDDKGDGGGEHIMHVEQADQKIQDAPVDDEGDHTHNAEFHQLFNQFFHTEY